MYCMLDLQRIKYVLHRNYYMIMQNADNEIAYEFV